MCYMVRWGVGGGGVGKNEICKATWKWGREIITDFVAIPDDKTKISHFLVTWPLRSLGSQVTEDRTSSFAPWFRFISSSQRNFKAPSMESMFPGGILILSENPSLIGKKY